VLAHAFLAPLGGAVVGALFGLPIAVMMLTSKADFGMAMSVHWGEVIKAALPVLARGLAGTVPLVLWLSPLIFTLMAASAWLKRLGVPLVLVGGGVAVTVLYKAYDIEWPLHQLMVLNDRINHSLIQDANALKDTLVSDGDLWAWMLHDLGRALADLASPQFIGWALVAAAGFVLVVMKRSRGG